MTLALGILAAVLLGACLVFAIAFYGALDEVKQVTARCARAEKALEDAVNRRGTQ